MLVGDLDPRDLSTIYVIGQERAPEEACGLLLPRPVPDNHQPVIELPNDHSDPEHAFLMNPRRLNAIAPWFIELDAPDSWMERVAFWHTHPGGLVGPSSTDMSAKSAHVFYYLVVTLTATGPVPTWY